MRDLLVAVLLLLTAGLNARSQTPPDAADRERSLAAAVEAFSQASTTLPPQQLAQSLWELSGRDMATALRYADRVQPAEARYGVSLGLWERQPNAYYAYRRPRQSVAGLLLAAPFGILLIWRRFRHPAGLILVSVLGWAGWSLISKDFRQLPPQPYPFLTSSFLAFLAAGISSAMVGLVRWDKMVSSRIIEILGRVGVAGAWAGILAALVCLWTRSAGLFPIVHEGWDLIIEPFGSLVLGILAGALLAFYDALMTGRRARTEPAAL